MDFIQSICPVCGSPATEKHHLNQKGIGGRGRKADEGPLVSLCGFGNNWASDCLGCHGAVHHHLLHIRVRDGIWECLWTFEPTKEIYLSDDGWTRLRRPDQMTERWHKAMQDLKKDVFRRDEEGFQSLLDEFWRVM